MTTIAPPAPTAPGVENLPVWHENVNRRIVCPDCKIDPPDLVEEGSDLCCANCGRVLEDRMINYESEWRTFNNDEKGGEDPTRVGDADNELLFGQQGTTIGGGGANLSREARKLKKAQAMQNEDKNNRALQNAYNIIDTWADAEHLTHGVKNTAKSLYKQVYEIGSLRGKNLNVVLASCLFIACRNSGAGRSFAEIMSLTKVPKKEIGRTFKQITELVSKQSEQNREAIVARGGVVNPETSFKSAGPNRPRDLVDRFANMLGMPFRVQAVAKVLADKVISGVITVAGRSPLSTAGSAMFFASHFFGVGQTFTEIAQVAKVSDATIKQAYKKLYEHREQLIEKEWLGPQPVTVKDQTPLIGDLANLPKIG